MKKFLLYFVLTIIIIFIVTLFFGTYEENGDGMAPTINNHETTLVFKPVFFPQKYKTGDIVIYANDPNDSYIEYVGRILAVPGETIMIHNGKLYKDFDGKIQELEENSYNMNGAIPIKADSDDRWIKLNGYLIFLDKTRGTSALYKRIVAPNNIVGKIYFVFR